MTFVPPPGARALVGDFTDWLRRPMPVSGPVTRAFPPGSYIEYAYLDAEGRPFPDPAATHLAENPWWDYARAVVLPGWRYEAPPQFVVPPDRLQRIKFESRAFGEPRRLIIYEPAEQPRAVLFVQDGVAFFRIGKMAEIAEALIRSGEIHPVRIVFIEPSDRNREYRFSPAYRAFVLKELLPRFSGGLPAGLWGASLGGLASLWLWGEEAAFSFAMAHSPALRARPGGSDAHRDPEWLTERLGEKTLSGRVYIEVGLLEWLLAPARRFAAMLAEGGVPHAYRERPSGHNWVTWRQGIAPGLKELLGRDLPL